MDRELVTLYNTVRGLPDLRVTKMSLIYDGFTEDQADMIVENRVPKDDDQLMIDFIAFGVHELENERPGTEDILAEHNIGGVSKDIIDAVNAKRIEWLEEAGLGADYLTM